MQWQTRLAPSPTGEMHTGHLLHLIHVFGIAQALNGRIVFRMEDHDRLRCRPEFHQQWIEDLQWLGFTTGNEEWSVQSAHPGRYENALASLRNQGMLYACSCSRRSIDERKSLTGNSETGYDGHCRNRDLAFQPGYSIRIHLEDDHVTFRDLQLGLKSQRAAAYADPVLVDNRGQFTYTFCVVVDDFIEDINLIIRGEDILSSTAEQLQLRSSLQRSLNVAGVADERSDPTFYHHPVLLDETGSKLSKSHRSLHLRAMRDRGLAADELLGRAAQLGGFQVGDTLRIEECPRLFSGMVNL